MVFRSVPLGFSLLLVAACAPAPGATPPKSAAAPVSSAPPTAAPPAPPVKVTEATRLTTLPIEPRPELVEAFEREGVSGTIAIFDPATGKLGCSDVPRCRRAHLPASTFKIPNSIIGLETGVVSDPETPLPWNGTNYQNPDWNQDHTLRSAVRVSCVPCFQLIARNVGDQRMREWVTRLDYGNKDISGGLERFWLTGGLRITPVEELDFLRRLDLGKLPISERTRDIVLEVITLDVAEDYLLRGKTGSLGPPEGKELVGWFVGWVERGPRKLYFATELDGHLDGVDFLKARRRVTERVLQMLGA
jgi:beta-lactamase class D